MNLVELTRRLVDIPSPTGEEGTVGRFLASYLQERGYTVEAQEVGAGRANVLAWSGDTDAAPPRVVFSTHMDTVPPYIPSSEDETFVHGRGACDAKGILAAQMEAADALRAEGRLGVGLLITVDEEAGGGGARVANTHPLAVHCRYLINGEPTDNRLAVGTKGSLRVRLRAAGRAAHSAYPEQGESAIDKLLDVLASIRALSWPSDPLLGDTTVNIGVLSGGRASNVIADEAAAQLHFRLVTPSGGILARLEECLTDGVTPEVLSIAEPQRLHEVAGFETCIVRFSTDIPHLPNWGTPLLLGPGSILVAHTAEERVAKRDLAAAAELYARLARTLLNEEEAGS